MNHILRDHDLLLHRQYDSASSDLSLLVTALHDELLPRLSLELKLTDSDIAWLAEWFSDIASVFRLLKRHNFSRPLVLQEIRAISTWRLRVLRPVLVLPHPTIVHCLPPPITDPLGRPMLILKLAPLRTLSCSLRDALLQQAECMRLHLRHIRDHCAHTGSFPLQYLLLVDLDGISIQNPNLDLLSSLLTDIMPRFPGMLAAVFLLNYSWIHSGAWSVAKRVLSPSTIARVFFPSKAQLVSFCSAAALPAEYGGTLPPLDRIDDALLTRPPRPATPARVTPPPRRAPSTIALAPLSRRNPFYGYPAVASASASRPYAIRPVRRGLRELARTLAVLWWRRWGRWVVAGSYVAGICALLWVLVRRLARGRVVEALLGVVRGGRMRAVAR